MKARGTLYETEGDKLGKTEGDTSGEFKYNTLFGQEGSKFGEIEGDTLSETEATFYKAAL
jgi:hypothetical protein